MTYDEAMERFGHDAPDLRFGMEMVDMTDLARETEFRVFRGAAEAGGRVRGINAKGAADKYSRQDDRRVDRIDLAGFRRQGAGLVQGRGERQARLAHRQELQSRSAGKDRRADGGRPGRFAA